MIKRQEAKKISAAITESNSPDKIASKLKASVSQVARSASRKIQERSSQIADTTPVTKRNERGFLDHMQHRLINDDSHKLERRNSPLLPEVMTPATSMMRKSSVKKGGPPQKSQA